MAALLGLQFFGMDLSVFPTQIPVLNVVIVTTEFLFFLFIFRYLFNGLVFLVKQERAFWGIPTVPEASFLFGHAAFVSVHVCVCVHVFCGWVCPCVVRFTQLAT